MRSITLEQHIAGNKAALCRTLRFSCQRISDLNAFFNFNALFNKVNLRIVDTPWLEAGVLLNLFAENRVVFPGTTSSVTDIICFKNTFLFFGIFKGLFDLIIFMVFKLVYNIPRSGNLCDIFAAKSWRGFQKRILTDSRFPVKNMFSCFNVYMIIQQKQSE